MPKPESQPPVMPGDVVQITRQGHPQYMALLVVEQVQRRFVGAQLWASPEDDRFAYVRLRHDDIALCGTAALVSAEIGKARQAARETIHQIAKEKGIETP